MAKIIFSSEEVSVLKEAAEALKRGGEQEAKKTLAKLDISVSPELLAEMPSANVSSDGCYACIICLAIAFVAFTGFAK